MKAEYKLFLAGTPFFVIAAAVYGWWTAAESPTGQFEPVGTLAILLVGLLVAMIGGYLALTARRIGERPEDDPDGAIEQGTGDQGVYAPWSWWPLALGLSVAVCFLALAVGWWLLVIGLPFAVVALIGWVFEYSRGVHAH